ncbi:MAG TPA: hypothetical protein VE984_05645 [Gaiellaceae bacterium]|nr:hypothetical protein [Gaiellaceae bacterium]
MQPRRERATGCGAAAAAGGSGFTSDWCRRPRVEGLVLAQDRLLQQPELAARLEAQLGGQGPARVLVGLERLGLPAGAVEGEHEVFPQLLMEGLVAHERLELGNQLARTAEGEIGGDAVRRRRPAALLEATPFLGDEPLLG